MNVLEARRRLLGAGVYKKTVTGNPAIAQGSLARRGPGITMQGWTEQDSTTGAQLFDKSTVIKNKYINDSTGEMHDKAEGDTSASDYVLVRGLSYIRVTATTFAQWMAFYDINKDFISGINGYGEPIQVPQNAEYARFTIPNPVVDTFMVNAGSELLPWEPYTGGAPSPSPDYPQEIVSAGDEGEINVTVQGGNLLDADQYYEEYKQNNGTYIIFVNEMGGIRIPITEDMLGKQYTFSASGIPALNDAFYVQYYENANKIRNGNVIVEGTSTFSQSKITFIPEEMGGYIRLSHSRATDGTVQVKDIMLNVGASALPYEPYKQPQTVTLTSDRPLTKWDKLTKKDGVWGWEYGSAEAVLDGSEDEKWHNYSSQNGFYIVIPDMLIGNIMDGFCDIFIDYSLSEYKFPSIIFGSSDNAIYVLNVKDYASDVNSWKTWLVSNPITVLYQLAEPVFVPLSASEQEALNALHTNRPTTVLSNDTDCEMTLTYKTKKSLGGGYNPYGLEIGGIAVTGIETDNTNRIRTGYILFSSDDGTKRYVIDGYAPYSVVNNIAYDSGKNAISTYTQSMPPAGTSYVRISFRKIGDIDFTEAELDAMIKTFTFKEATT